VSGKRDSPLEPPLGATVGLGITGDLPDNDGLVYRILEEKKKEFDQDSAESNRSEIIGPNEVVTIQVNCLAWSLIKLFTEEEENERKNLPLEPETMTSGFSVVTMEVTQPLWPLRVPRRVICSAIVFGCVWAKEEEKREREIFL